MSLIIADAMTITGIVVALLTGMILGWVLLGLVTGNTLRRARRDAEQSAQAAETEAEATRQRAEDEAEKRLREGRETIDR
ncbi:MAG: hypothetical protein ACYTG1_00215, partial [Planctomycetota bacterium]